MINKLSPESLLVVIFNLIKHTRLNTRRDAAAVQRVTKGCALKRGTHPSFGILVGFSKKMVQQQLQTVLPSLTWTKQTFLKVDPLKIDADIRKSVYDFESTTLNRYFDCLKAGLDLKQRANTPRDHKNAKGLLTATHELLIEYVFCQRKSDTKLKMLQLSLTNMKAKTKSLRSKCEASHRLLAMKSATIMKLNNDNLQLRAKLDECDVKIEGLENENAALQATLAKNQKEAFQSSILLHDRTSKESVVEFIKLGSKYTNTPTIELAHLFNRETVKGMRSSPLWGMTHGEILQRWALSSPPAKKMKR